MTRRPKLAETHHALGLVHQDRGDLAGAVKHFREAVRCKRDYVDALVSLGVALDTQGKSKEAEDCFRKVLRLDANHHEAMNHLGIALQCQGKLDEAATCLRKALRIKPDFALAHNNLAGVLLKQGKASEGALCLRKAIRLDPSCVDAHYNLGNILQARGELSEAAACYREALRLRSDFPLARFNLGTTLVADNQPAAGMECFREVLRQQPHMALAHTNLGHLLLEEGKRNEAVQHFREALRYNPACGNALAAVAFHGLYPLTKAELDRIQILLADSQLDPEDRARLHFGLGHMHDRADACDNAFAHFREANRVRRQMFRAAGKAFDADDHSAWIDRIIAVCDLSYFERVRGLGRASERPVFIVGMPRSGTSLVEQILASHPKVFGAGELLQIPTIIRQLPSRLGTADRYPDCLTRLDGMTAGDLADTYLQHLDMLDQTADRVTDKLPNNYQFLGLIAALFPRARVIHCKRDPLDVCLSCYVHDFKDWTSDLESLARYYLDYERLMAHWRSVLPLPLVDVVYEEMVANPEAVSRRLVSFCGLEWDERCLAHHKTQRVVRTASLLQVRQPVYQSSVGRWRRYEAQLRPLRDALGGVRP